MKIWIDLYAAPDPFFFRPIIERARALGHQTVITSRDFNETVEVARHCGFGFDVIGRHGGRRLHDRMSCACDRVSRLARYARENRPDVAVSFNSYSQAVASAFLGIRFVTFMDYEYHPLNRVAFRLADDVIVPAGYDAGMLAKQAGSRKKVHRFEGLKEHVSVTSFCPDRTTGDKLQLLGVESSDVMVTMRPPPDCSSYHRFENELFYQLLSFMAAQPKVKVIYLPRNRSQLDRVSVNRRDNVITPPFFMDGFQLVYFSDLVISAGGSMNREAVVLGTPAYTTFQGRMAGVDKDLIQAGLLTRIESPRQFGGIMVEKCAQKRQAEANPALAQRFAEIICTGSTESTTTREDHCSTGSQQSALLSCPARLRQPSNPAGSAAPTAAPSAIAPPESLDGIGPKDVTHP